MATASPTMMSKPVAETPTTSAQKNSDLIQPISGIGRPDFGPQSALSGALLTKQHRGSNPS
ncbi:hypothetical protein AB5I41_28715 [Sphingomonas sp. MMS24-JH45]